MRVYDEIQMIQTTVLKTVGTVVSKLDYAVDGLKVEWDFPVFISDGKW